MTAGAGKNREDGADTRQRPARGNGFDSTRVRVWSGPGDVVVQERDERLTCGHSGGSADRGSQDTGNRRRDQSR